MDSFYDVPRRPPQPIPREMFPATPVVPEISVLCPSNTPRNAFTPYNEWKTETMPNNFLINNKENFNGPFQNTQNNSILKKQVRFESPVLQEGPTDPFLNKKQPDSGRNQGGNETNHKPQDQARAVPSFEQMYMANIPNRQLDLSVIDVPKRIIQNEGNNEYCEGKILSTATTQQSTEKRQPKTYREFLESQKKENKVVLNDSVTDIFNYKRITSPKVTHKVHGEANKDPQSSLSKPNVYQPAGMDTECDTKENNRIMNPEQHFQHVTEAISGRNIPTPYENTYLKGSEQKRIIEYDKPWFLSENNYCPDNVLIKTDINNTPYVQGNDMRNDFLKKYSEDTQNNECVSFEQKNMNNNPYNMPARQFENRSNPVLLELGSINLSKDTIQHAVCHTRQECYTQTTNDLNRSENNALKVRGSDDFCVKDLLKIIAQQNHQISQQNEQLLLLQKQVSTLIDQQIENGCSRQKSIQCGQEQPFCQQENNCYNKTRHCCKQGQHYEQKHACIEGTSDKNIQDRCITSTQHENCEGMRKKLEATPKKNKNNLPNFSIGLTTSFEVSFRRPPKNHNDFLQKNKHLPDFNQYEPPKIQEITETESTEGQENCQQNIQRKIDSDNKETLIDESLIFKEPIQVRESCPSPEPSIKINMNDFEDSESDDDLTSSEIGPSFYRNLMIQVNKILQKAQIETTEEATYNFKGQHLKQNTLHKVKEATMKHLRRIGVEVQNSEDSSQSSNSSDGVDDKSYNQEDISFAVKQLLMKYLPADHLARIAYKEPHQPVNHVLTSKEKIGAIKNRPDFSFATVQYMKKYNLIANNQKDFHHATRNNQPESPKVLDITKLKQQPKLL